MDSSGGAAVAARKLQDMIARKAPLDEIGAHLDGLGQPERIAAAISLPGALQAQLFEAAAGAKPVTLEDIVPAARGPMKTVRHHGRNSLPLFTRFEKRFCRPPAGSSDAVKGRVFGYNHQAMSWITGPGCYVGYEGPQGEFLVDYRDIPCAVPEGWPRPVSNASGRSRLVWKNLVDHLRRVSRHVTIGRAFRAPAGQDPGVIQNNWFILCRED